MGKLTASAELVYVVERIDRLNEGFDRSILGFTYSQLAAEEFVADQVGDILESYVGWDEESYPKFQITEARILG